MRQRFFISSMAKLRCIVLIVLLIGVYVITKTSFIYSGNGYIFNYIIKPLAWVSLAFLVWVFPRARSAGKLRLRRFLNKLVLICACFYILVIMAGGLIDGLGKSPYSFTPLGILNNFLFIGSMVVGMELARAFIINNLAAKRAFLIIGLVSLFFSSFSMSFSKIVDLHSGLDIVEYAGNTFLPALSENILLSYLAFLGGPIPALIYHGTLEAFRWFSPMLPNLGWLTGVFLGSFTPIFSLLLVQRMYMLEAREIREGSTDKENPVGWVVCSVLSVFLIWFAVGLFPIYPSIILTGSMEPMIKPGDVVLVKKLKGREVKLGDVVQFRDLEQKVSVTHRVIGVNYGTEITYQTKGDANKAPDSNSVKPGQVRGKVIQVVPKIGWPTLVLKTRGEVLSQDTF